MADAAEVGLAVADPEPADVQPELGGEGGGRGFWPLFSSRKAAKEALQERAGWGGFGLLPFFYAPPCPASE